MTNSYPEQKMADALEAIDTKGNIVLQKNDEDALLFMPGAVAKFCIAHGYDEQTCSWSHGSYFSNLTAASMEFSPVETHANERTNAIEHIDNLMDKIDSLESAGVTDADTVLADMIERADFEQSGVAAEIFDLYTEADGAGREIIGSMFESLIGESFDTFLSEATKACEKTLESSEIGEALDEIMEQKAAGPGNFPGYEIDDYKNPDKVSVSVIPVQLYWKDDPSELVETKFSIEDTCNLAIDEQITFSGYTENELVDMIGMEDNGEDFVITGVGPQSLILTEKKVPDHGRRLSDKQVKAKTASDRLDAEREPKVDVPIHDEESLDEMMEQVAEVAGNGEIGDEMSVSNRER